MKNISIWQDNIKTKNFNKLNKDLNIDVLIIGGGMTGVSTLYQLNDSNLKVVLVEQNKIGMGVTSRSTGKINYLQNDLIDKIRTNFNDKVASLYLESQVYAKNELVKVIKDNKLNCDLENINTYLYTSKLEEINKLVNLEKILINNKIKVHKDKVNLVDSLYTIRVDDCYVFNPLKYLYELLNRINHPIYEKTSIEKIEKKEGYYLCKTDNNIIKTKWLIIASHYPFFYLPYLFPLKSSLEKSYLSASIYDTKPLSLISYNKPVISIRNYKNHLIYLTNSHLINKKVDDNKNFEEHLKEIKKLKLQPSYLWSNIDIMTSDGLPYIGELDNKMLIGTGYNTWGFTNGFLASVILSDIINNKKNKYKDLFDPNRTNVAKIFGIIPNSINSIEGYAKGLFVTNKNVIYKQEDNKDIMIYKDNKKEHKVQRKCPHLGCKLLFNEKELTWDCPCHGSRFEIDGNCISGPANKNINLNKNIDKKK